MSAHVQRRKTQCRETQVVQRHRGSEWLVIVLESYEPGGNGTAGIRDMCGKVDGQRKETVRQTLGRKISGSRLQVNNLGKT